MKIKTVTYTPKFSQSTMFYGVHLFHISKALFYAEREKNQVWT